MKRENYKTPVFKIASFCVWLLLINGSTILVYHYSNDVCISAIFASFLFIGLFAINRIHEYEDTRIWIETIEKVEEEETK